MLKTVLLSLLLISQMSCVVFELDINLSKSSSTRSRPLRLLETKYIKLDYNPNFEFYSTKLSIGTPEQVFDVQVDTTTSVTWVPSSAVKNNQNVTNVYYSNRSKTSKASTNQVEIDDEDGDVTGTTVQDTVRISNSSLNNFHFVEVNKYDGDFNDYTGGKLGLGFYSRYGDKYSIIHALQAAKVIDEKVFGIVQTNSTISKLVIGGYPSNVGSGYGNYSTCNLSSTEGLSDEYKDGWVCDLSHIILGEISNLTEAIEIDGRVIFDSGNTYITAPKGYIKHFVDFFKDQNITCNVKTCDSDQCLICPRSAKYSSMGDISFLLDGYAYAIPVEELFDTTTEEKNEFLIRFNSASSNIWSLGHPFFNQYTVVFDGENEIVGFAGGDRDDYVQQWLDWYNGDSAADKAKRYFYMLVGGAVFGFALFILIVFFIVHSARRRRLEEHGPLVNEKY